MPLGESAKKLVEGVTGLGRPDVAELEELLRPRKAHAWMFRDDGVIPNHPTWPLVLYRSPVRLPPNRDPAAVFEVLFDGNGWGSSWRNGIYDYVHYHSHTHEVLGVARGTGQVQFGGNRGRTLKLKAGDVVILPAGTGHKLLTQSPDLLVVGAYPPQGTYDECSSSEDHDRALATISKVPRPGSDPIYGRDGPLRSAWRV